MTVQTAPGHRSGARQRRAGLVSLLALLVLGGLVVLQVVLAAPARAQLPGLDDCKEAPNPERPGSGMVGAIDPAPIGTGAPGSVYDEVGYAGLVWHTYDLGCGPSGVRNPEAVIDSWTGNLLFNVGKAIVGASNGLHYVLLDGGPFEPLNALIVSGTAGLYDSVYAPWFGLVAVLLAIVLFRSIWRGDLAAVSRRALWALAAIWLAAATYLTPLLYTQLLDEVLVEGSNQIRTGFLQNVGVDQRDALPTLLHEQVVYRNWLRGVFGSPDGPQAEQLGRDLVRAQAYTKEEIAAGADDPNSGVAERKNQEYHTIATQTGSAYGYFQGVDGSRIGVGFLASLQSVMFALFHLLAQAALLLAQILLRVVILLGPVIGLIAILYHDLLRGIGRVVGAALLNVILLAALTALHTLVLVWVFNPVHGMSVLVQMVIAGLITLVMLMVAKPLRRMWQMVELSVGAVGGAMPGAPPGVLSRLRRRRAQDEPTASERFWEEARDREAGAAGTGADLGSGSRYRPEGSVAVVAVAERLDRPSVGTAGTASGASGSAPYGSSSGSSSAWPPSGGASNRTGGGSTRAGAPIPVLPPGSRPDSNTPPSRIVDTPPVTPARWDRVDDDPVYVPSRSSRPRRPPQRADLEEVAGQPVWVVYRPSAGLEIDDRHRDRARDPYPDRRRDYTD